jgi:ElaA protein
MNFEYIISRFDDLTNIQLYQLLYLREQVFNIEQQINCPDLDNLDLNAKHILVYDDQTLVGYARIYKKEAKVGKIGRVVVQANYRGMGLASKIVCMAIEELKVMGMDSILIRGQSHLVKLYCRCGFEIITEPFIYEGIEHLDFERKL